MARHNRNFTKATLVLALAASLAMISPANAANPFDSLTNMFSDKDAKTTGKKKKAGNEKAGLAATGCIAGAILSKAQGGKAEQGCAQGAVKNITEADAREEQEMLVRKDSVAWGNRIDSVNERVIARQPRIEKIAAEKNGDLPQTPPDVVIDAKCSASPTCKQAALAAAANVETPGLFRRLQYWLFPGSAPAAKAELKEIETDIALLERSSHEIKAEIAVKQDTIDLTRDMRRKSDISREKGVLVFELSQASQTIALLKSQSDELDKSYLSYICAFFAAFGATIMKKFSDGAVGKTFDGVKGLASIATRRNRKKQPEQKKNHSMY